MESRKFETNQSETANDAYKSTLKDIISMGYEIQAKETLSVGSNKKFKEIFFMVQYFLIFILLRE